MQQSKRYMIPEDYKSEFERTLLKNNFTSLSLVSIMFLIAEIFLYTIRDRLYGTGLVILVFIVVNIVLVPIIWRTSRHIDTMPIILSKSIQLVYSYAIIFFVIALFLRTQFQIDLSYLYVASVLGLSSFIVMNVFERLLLLLPPYMILIILLAQFQSDFDVVFVIAINMFIINLISWGLGLVLMNFRRESFLNQKLLIEKNKLLEDLIKKDAMTGLYTHNASFIKLKEEIEYSNRIGYPVSLIIVDIDDFKKVNDTHGHLAGDSVLIKLSEIMVKSTRITDTVGRYGGEEFIIILPNTNSEGAIVLAQKIQEALRVGSFEQQITITLSGGISQYSNESVEGLIKLTDEKLYKAKAAGKNCFIHSNESVKILK